MSCNQQACCPDDTALADTATQCAATDPTLAACCLREIQQQRYANQLRARLLEHDPTYTRRDIKLHTVATPPASNSDSEDSVDDDVVVRLHAMRLRQMQDTAAQRRTVAVQDVVPEAALQQMRTSHGVVVWHVHQAGCATSDEVDEVLAVHAARDLTVCRVPTTRRLCHELGLVQGGLVVVEDGAVLATIPTVAFERDGAFEEHVMVKWLRRVLPANMLGAQESSSDDESEACEECGRTYPHQHVRNITQLDDDDL